MWDRDTQADAERADLLDADERALRDELAAIDAMTTDEARTALGDLMGSLMTPPAGAYDDDACGYDLEETL